MPEEIVGAPAVSPPPQMQPAPSADVVPSATQAPETAPPPSSQPETPKPWNMPPEQRWEELRQERDEARRALQDVVARVSQPQPIVAPATPEADPWDGLVNHPDPATAQFWQQQYKLQQPLLQRVQGLERTVEVGTQELASLRVENFRFKNPDITPNSPEEQAISGYVKAGYPLEAARKMGLFDLHYGKLREEVSTLKGKQGAIPQKVAANASESSTGIPATSGLPRPPGDWRERVRSVYRKGGGLAEVANAAGMQPTA